MKKLFIFIFFLIFKPVNAFFLESIVCLKEGAEKQQLAANELSKNRALIKIIKKRGNGSPIIPPLYLCNTAIAYKSIKNYKWYENALFMKITLSQLFDGLILGIVATLCSKKFPHKTPSIIYATIASAIALVIHQNSIMGNVPYFDCYLKRYEDQFSNFSFQTFVNIACVLISAGLGSHIVNKVIKIQQ